MQKENDKKRLLAEVKKKTMEGAIEWAQRSTSHVTNVVEHAISHFTARVTKPPPQSKDKGRYSSAGSDTTAPKTLDVINGFDAWSPCEAGDAAFQLQWCRVEEEFFLHNPTEKRRVVFLNRVVGRLSSTETQVAGHNFRVRPIRRDPDSVRERACRVMEVTQRGGGCSPALRRWYQPRAGAAFYVWGGLPSERRSAFFHSSRAHVSPPARPRYRFSGCSSTPTPSSWFAR